MGQELVPRIAKLEDSQTSQRLEIETSQKPQNIYCRVSYSRCRVCLGQRGGLLHEASTIIQIDEMPDVQSDQHCQAICHCRLNQQHRLHECTLLAVLVLLLPCYWVRTCEPLRRHACQIPVGHSIKLIRKAKTKEQYLHED